MVIVPYRGYAVPTARTCASRVAFVRGANAIDANDVCLVMTAPREANSSSSESDAGVQPLRTEKTMSPPISARDCSRTERVMFPAKESIATSAATPSEIDDMYSSSLRRVLRDSRQARPNNEDS